ncbi:MAG: (2Fe-2S)-binding protein [Candidatus Izemoplasmatales bacterium]|jgi:bacterioferritin-associated ferredoxin|nr:(2Fe-2S)-binding protein [Candidatus Izemoplasmatales bacterium]
MNKDKIIICRCSDVTLEDIHKLLEEGYTSFEDLKRLLRIGMGPCQGQTCAELVRKEIANFLHQKAETVPIHKTRPLTIGVKLRAIAEGAKDEN